MVSTKALITKTLKFIRIVCWIQLVLIPAVLFGWVTDLSSSELVVRITAAILGLLLTGFLLDRQTFGTNILKLVRILCFVEIARIVFTPVPRDSVVWAFIRGGVAILLIDIITNRLEEISSSSKFPSTQ